MKSISRLSTTAVFHSIAVAAVAGVLFFCGKANSGNGDSAKKDSASTSTATVVTSAPVSPEKIIVYYFHTTQRCPTCHKLESFAKSEIENSFSDAITDGKLEWKTVNVEENGNGHYSDDYKLYTKSVIISTLRNGKESSWKNLDKIWQLVGDEEKYRTYIREEVAACLSGKCL